MTTYPWTRGPESNRAANSAVPTTGNIGVTNEGNAYVSDGSTPWSGLVRLAKTADIDARTITGAAVTLTSAGTLTAGRPNLVDATSGSFTATMPTPTTVGQTLSVAKADTTGNTIALSGTFRGSASTLSLSLPNEALVFRAESLTSWRPESDHKTLSSLDNRYAGAIFNVKTYGAKGDGTTDDTAAVAAAAAAMVAAGAGTLFFPASTYKVTALPNLTPIVTSGPLTYAVIGAGSEVTVINHYGTTVASSLSCSNPGFDVNNASFGAPRWGGFTIDGTNTSGGVCGLRWGDVSFGTIHDVVLKNFATGDGFTAYSGYGWTEGMNLNAVRLIRNGCQLRFDVGSGAVFGTVSTTISSGVATTSIAVAGGVTRALYSGQQFSLAAATSAPGVTVQSVTTSAAVSVGATSIPVNSFTPTTTYPAGTAQVSKGSYGSFDYWTVQQMYWTAGANQHGMVSEVPRGLGGNIDRLGSSYRITGNFGEGSGNTGILFWLKGKDNFDNVQWDVSCEVDGSGGAHKSVQLDTSTSFFGGFGRFVAYYFGAYSAAGGSYQMGTSGRVCIANYSDTDGTGSQVNMVLSPFSRSVKGSVTVTGGSAYPTTVTSGSSYQNTTGKDLLITIPVTSTASTCTVSWNVDTYSGLGTGVTEWTNVPSGQVVPLKFVHYAGSYAKVTVSGGTLGTPFTRYV